MKKKIIPAAVLILLGAALYLLVLGNSGGNVSQVSTSFTSTDHHSEEAIKECMKLVKEFFQENYEGCTLTELWYDDQISLASEAEWAEQYDGEEAMVLLSDFETGDFVEAEGFMPNETYSDWQWILVKNSRGEWALETWGY